MSQEPIVALVVGMARNRVIGRDGDMPWHLSSDLKRFKALTMGHPILMGRKTYESIGRPLPGRFTVVVTRDETFRETGVKVARNIAEGLETARDIAREKGVDTVMVVGGGEIYAQTLPFAEKLYVTEIDAVPEGDTLFPAIDPAKWQQLEREEHPSGEKDDHAFAFVTYGRRQR